jgi:hypothetical protein
MMRARGTATSVLPNVPVSLRVRWPCRRRCRAILAGLAPPVARPRQGVVQFLLRHCHYEATLASANPILGCVEPVIEKQNLNKISAATADGFCGILGLVSIPVLQRWNLSG